MNLNPGGSGKKPKMRDTIFDGKIQTMNFPDDFHDLSLCGKPKGIKLILEERELWPKEGLRLTCNNKNIEANTSYPDCCARHKLGAQPDFMTQIPLIQEVIENHGHKVIFYPKYHCELNYIEMYWGAAKWYARENCNYTWAGLLKTVPLALDSVSLNSICKFARKSFQYMECYRKGLNVKQAEYAVKKYKSHRKIPDTILTDLDVLTN